MKKVAYQASDLLGDLLEMIEQRWVSSENILQLVERSQMPNTAAQIVFLQELKKVMRMIPSEAFKDEEQRQNLLTAAQEALDKTIDQEEDERIE